MKNKEEVLAHLFNAYSELSFAEEELCDNDDECLYETIENIKEQTVMAILSAKGRVLENWMTIHNYVAITLEDEDWEHYKKGACLCFAKSSSECLCGAWDLEDDFYE